MPSATKNLFEKRFLDFQKLFTSMAISFYIIKNFCGVQGRFL